jgi:hypothetical protein
MEQFGIVRLKGCQDCQDFNKSTQNVRLWVDPAQKMLML